MSIWATWLNIEDEAERKALMKEKGITYLVIGDEDEETRGPIEYKGSHILPSDTDTRSGSFSVSAIPDHIEREDRPEVPEGTPKPWLRFTVTGRDFNAAREGEDVHTYLPFILDKEQVEDLHDTLHEWLLEQKGL